MGLFDDVNVKVAAQLELERQEAAYEQSERAKCVAALASIQPLLDETVAFLRSQAIPKKGVRVRTRDYEWHYIDVWVLGKDGLRDSAWLLDDDGRLYTGPDHMEVIGLFSKDLGRPDVGKGGGILIPSFGTDQLVSYVEFLVLEHARETAP